MPTRSLPGPPSVPLGPRPYGLHSHPAVHPLDLTHPLRPPQVLDRVRQVATAKGKNIAMMLDTKGPEIRTAMLKGGKSIEIKKGDMVRGNGRCEAGVAIQHGRHVGMVG